MTTLDLRGATRLFWGATEAQALYYGGTLLWTKPAGLPSDTIIRWKATEYAGPALTGGMPTATDGVLRFPGGLATTYALGQQMTGFYACICGRNSTTATNFVRQMVGLTNSNNSFSSTSRMDLNKFVNGYAVRHNPNNGEVSGNAFSLTLTDIITVEGWVVSGEVGVAINGNLIQSNPTAQSIIQTSNIVLMNSGTANTDYDMNGMVVMGRMPNDQERSQIRVWVA